MNYEIGPKQLKSLSIILPCYNEEENVARVVAEAVKVASSITSDYEIIVVNDGSKDKTSEIAHKLAASNDSIVVLDQENKGYGGALKAGFAAATKKWLFFTDADLQFDLAELEQFAQFANGYKFIFGYRKQRADKFHRKLIAFMLKLWNKFWLNFPLYIRDIDCAFKLMDREEFAKLGPIISDGAMINSEFILKIVRKGHRIKQIGVNHYPRVYGQSTGSSLKVIAKAVRDTFILRKYFADSAGVPRTPLLSPFRALQS